MSLQATNLSPLAGKLPLKGMLIDPVRLLHDYYAYVPDTLEESQRVSFGTSGHRGSPLFRSFTEAHVLAITQAICDYRCERGISGPLFLGKDTHAISAPAELTALTVLAANDVEVVIQDGAGFTPTPAISRAILVHNHGRKHRLADGIVITPSHNPPGDGGFKYNPPNGGPAGTNVTHWIEQRANVLLQSGNRDVRRLPRAAVAESVSKSDFLMPYVRDLGNVIDMEALRVTGVKFAVDPLGGAAVHYWEQIAEFYGLDLSVVNGQVDSTFAFMPCDHDGKIRMDCSSAYAMTRLVDLKDRYRVAFGNDTDADRHGIVIPASGLMNPNHYLAVAIRYLLTHRSKWPVTAAVGKTLVSSAMIDRVAADLGRPLCEVPVGFKWFAPELFTGSCCFAGEESAGASFLRHDGTVWTTDKDGLIMGLLAAEITARTGKDPGEHYAELTRRFGSPSYTRIDAPATPSQKQRLAKLSAVEVAQWQLAGEPITAKMTCAPGNGAPIDGLKIVTRSGWFAARPSGTEDLYKIYAESFTGESHLEAIVEEAQSIVATAIGV